MTSDTLHPAPEELFAYRDGELPAERRALVETHVLACRSCRELVDEMSKLEAALRARPDEVGDAYYERMQGQVMAKVHAALPPAPARAAAARAVKAPLERRRDDAEIEERRGRAPRLPWVAVGSAVSAMAAVVVVVVLLARHGAPPPVAVLERSAPDAGRLGGARSDTVASPALGSASEPAPPADARAKQRALEQAKPVPGSADQVALAPEAPGEKKIQARNEERDEQAFSKLESAPAPQSMKDQAANEAQGGIAQLDLNRQRAQAAAPPAAAPGQPAAPGNRFESALSRYGLPPVWGPGVSDDLVLKAEPVFRNLYRTGGATTALDSARVRLYLAEAARLRAGSAPDSAAIDEIAHHYRRAIRLGASDPGTAATAERRLRDFLSEVGISP